MKIFCLILLISFSSQVYGAEKLNPEIVNRLAAAIYKAEGGDKTKYPYGIKSINTFGDKDKAKKICINTINNNWIRYNNQSKYTNYIEFLGSRYCPIGANNDPKGLNKNWVSNVKKLSGLNF
jgi:hypothetical protein